MPHEGAVVVERVKILKARGNSDFLGITIYQTMRQQENKFYKLCQLKMSTTRD